MIPQKTFLLQKIELFESDFSCDGSIKLNRIMEFMQNLATDHADQLGFGWNTLDDFGVLWVLSKVKYQFDVCLTKGVKSFYLYTWPLAPNRFFADRLFVAVDKDGRQLFSATTSWLVIDKQSRKICSSEKLQQIYNCDFDTTTVSCPSVFEKIKKDDEFTFAYSRQMRFCDLDVNMHVNNTCYVNYALDAVGGGSFSTVEIVYHKEVLPNEVLDIYYKQTDDGYRVVGVRQEETCFTVKFVK